MTTHKLALSDLGVFCDHLGDLLIEHLLIIRRTLRLYAICEAHWIGFAIVQANDSFHDARMPLCEDQYNRETAVRS